MVPAVQGRQRCELTPNRLVVNARGALNTNPTWKHHAPINVTNHTSCSRDHLPQRNVLVL